jgi:L-malate glycosyltransferase
MKIAFVYDAIYPFIKGGVEKRVWELAVRLTRNGHEVHLYGMKFWDGESILVRDGVILHGVCPAQNLYAHGKRTIRQAIAFSFALFFQLRREQYDLIDCQQFPYFSCIAAKWCVARKKIPLVITWHEVWGDYWYTYLGRVGIFGKYIEHYVSGLTRHIVAVSTTTAQNLDRACGRKKVIVLPNGVDLSRINAIQPYDEPSDIIFAGRLIREKHVDLLVRAMKILVQEHAHYQLLIIGEGPEQETIARLVCDLSLESQVRIMGFRENYDEVIARMKSSKVCVLPSTREGFGITALEALACGLPVVTVDHPANAIRDLIADRNGFLCNLSAQDLADAIRLALQKYTGMRDACRASAAPFDWDRITRDVESYYRSVIDGPRES